MAAIKLAAGAAQVAFLLQGFQHRRQCAAVKVEKPPHDLAVGLAEFPKHRHCKILGVSQIQSFKQWLIGADQFF